MKKLLWLSFILLITFPCMAGENLTKITQDVFFDLDKTTLLQAEVALTAVGMEKDNTFQTKEETCVCYTSARQKSDGSFNRAFIYSSDGKTVHHYDFLLCTKRETRDKMYDELYLEMAGWGTAFTCENDRKVVSFDEWTMIASSEMVDINLHSIPALRLSFCTKSDYDKICAEWKREEREKTATITGHTSFPGGPEAIQSYLKANIRYPQMAKEFGIEGVVILKAYIQEDGSVAEISVKRGVDKQIDAEAKRVVSDMPKWTPAVADDGLPIRESVEIPVVFKCIPQPNIAVYFGSSECEPKKYGAYETNAFEEGVIIFDANIDKTGKATKLKLNKSQTTVKSSTVISAAQHLVETSVFQAGGSNVKGPIKVLFQYVL